MLKFGSRGVSKYVFILFTKGFLIKQVIFLIPPAHEGQPGESVRVYPDLNL